jgi:hypothetical protein
MRYAALTIALTLFAACASANPTVDASQPRQRVVFSDPGMPTIFTENEHSVATTFSKPPSVVYAALKIAYTGFEVPLTIDDTRNLQLGNADFTKTRQFGGKPMASFVDCGSGITGPNATSYRIYMSLISTVTANGQGGSSVKTTLTASARDVAGGSSTDKLPCSTSGRLEAMLHARVVALIGS